MMVASTTRFKRMLEHQPSCLHPGRRKRQSRTLPIECPFQRLQTSLSFQSAGQNLATQPTSKQRRLKKVIFTGWPCIQLRVRDSIIKEEDR